MPLVRSISTRLATTFPGVLAQAEVARQEWREIRYGANSDMGSTATFYELFYAPTTPPPLAGVTYRRMDPSSPEDHRGMAEINLAAFGTSDPVPPDLLARWAGRPCRPAFDAEHVTVAVAGAALVAYCWHSPTSPVRPGRVLVETVAVHSDWKGQRIGRRLAASVAPAGGALTGWIPADDPRLARIALDAGALVESTVHVPRNPK